MTHRVGEWVDIEQQVATVVAKRTLLRTYHMYIHASKNAYVKYGEKMLIFVLNIGAFTERRYGVKTKVPFLTV